MLQPYLVVGIGGSGGKTVRALRHAIELTLRRNEWTDGMPDAWQFLHFDTPTVQDGEEFPMPFLPKDDYLSLRPGGVDYKGILQLVTSRVDVKHRGRIERLAPNAADVQIDIGIGAGQYRGLGKAIAFSSLDQMKAKAAVALARMKSNRANNQLTSLDLELGGLGNVGSPRLVIVSSIAGGSGAGQFLEATEAIKAAIGHNEAWSGHAVSFLYAPDVFSNLKGMGEGVAPNSLYALSETMNSIWNNAPSEAISSLFKNHGLMVGSSPDYRIGAAYNHIIGRTSGSVDLGSPDGVFMAVGDFLSTLMTDTGLQDDLNVGYFGNWFSRAIPAEDNTGLKIAASQPTPFSSSGFGKASLGLDQFENYSSERIARSVIHNLLSRHLAQDPSLKMESTERAWVEKIAEESQGDFFGDTKLLKQKSAPEGAFDVYFSLHPDAATIDSLTAQLQNHVMVDAQRMQGAPDGRRNSIQGLPPAQWEAIIQSAFQVLKPSLTEQFTQKVVARIRDEWVLDAPDRILGLVGTSMSQQGLPVTIELLIRLRAELDKTIAQLRVSSTNYNNDQTGLANAIRAQMQPVLSQPKVAQSNQTVVNAIRAAEGSLKNVFFSVTFGMGADLLEDFEKNFLSSLLRSLEAMQLTLSAAKKAGALSDGNLNPYDSWPKEDGLTPKRFEPAPNVALLIDHNDYPSTFDELARDTFGPTSPNPGQRILDEVCMGSNHVEKVTVDSKQAWSLVEAVQQWVPSDRRFQRYAAATQKANFKTVDDIQSYSDIARRWLMLGGRPFRAFLTLSLAKFLDANNDPILKATRENKFVEAFAKAAASSEPLVRLNEQLLQVTHGKTLDQMTYTIAADIPVASGTPLYDRLKNTLFNQGLWDETKSEKWFVGPESQSAARATEVFVCQMLIHPVQPIVMGSVVSPIASQWLKDSGDEGKRKAFMKWKQGRSLVESIPSSPEVWRTMLRGWHIANLLGLIHTEEGPASQVSSKGVKLSVWIDGGQKHADFPHPLFSEESASQSDLPAVILQSLKVALLGCYAVSSLSPLAPYQHLRRLGELGGGQSKSKVLRNWIESGAIDDGQPIPDANRAGAATDSLEIRKEKSIAFLEGRLKSLLAEMGQLDQFASPRSYPLVWEIREELEQSYRESIELVQSIRAQN